MGFAGIGSAWAAPPRYALDYDADPACPDLASFVQRVSARTENAAYDDDNAEQRFVVRLSRDGEQWQGEIVLRTPEARRTVAGAQCGLVADALALIVAVALDPASVLEISAPAAPAAASLESTPSTARAPSRVATEDGDARRDLHDRRERPARTLLVLGGAGSIASGPAPVALYGASIFGEIGLDGRTGPAFRALATRAATGVERIGSGAARFVLVSGRVEACPGALAAGPLLLTGCLDVEAGAIEAEGLARGSVSEPEEVTRFWAELGLMTRFSWLLFGPTRLELFGGVGAPLTRRAYVFEAPREVVHEPPALVGRIGLGLASEIP